MVRDLDCYNECVEKAKSHQYLYHYTNIDALEKILENNSLRLSRIDKVNDSEENKRITSLWHSKLFLACFTYKIDNEKYFYQNYGNVRLCFKQSDLKIDTVFFNEKLNQPLKNIMTDYNGRSDLSVREYDKFHWCVRDITISDVYYTDNFDDFKAEDGFESNAGLVKHKSGFDENGSNRNWETESETRVRVAIRPIGIEYDFRNNKTILPPNDLQFLYIALPKIEMVTIDSNMRKEDICKLEILLLKHKLLDKFTP